MAAPSVLASSQNHNEATPDIHLSALEALNNLLADHDQWSDDASSRILNSVLGTSNEPRISETRTPSQVAVHPYPQDMALPAFEQAHAITSLSPQTEVLQIMDTHASSFVTEPALPENSSQARSSPRPKFPTLQPQIRHHRHFDHPNAVVLPGMDNGYDPRTPIGTGRGITATTPSSNQANRHTLAQDIIRALRPPSTKRKRNATQNDEWMDRNVSEESPLSKKSRMVPFCGAPHTGIVNGVENALENDRLREDTRSIPTAAMQRPHAPGFDTQPVLGILDFQLPHYRSTELQRPPSHPVPSPQGTWQNSMNLVGQPSQHIENSGIWQTSNGLPLNWSPTSQPSGEVHPPPEPPRQNQTANRQPISVSNNTSTLTSAQAPQQSGLSMNEPISPPQATVPRTPLFLPSSESPPPSPSVGYSPSWKPSSLIPVVELGRPLSKLKSRAHLVKGLPKADVISASTSRDSHSEAEPFFGKPTGALAGSDLVSKSPGLTSSIKIRRSRSRVYVLIPKVDKRAWVVSGESSVTRESSNSLPRNEHSFERRHPIDEGTPYVQDFARRLIRRPCLWKSCHAVLDSTEKLLKHVKIVHGTQAEDELYRCYWKGCQNNGCYTDSEKLVRHLQWHVAARFYCGFEDCDFQTRIAERLAEHVTDDHDENESLRPIAVPTALVAPELPALLNNTLPSYLSISRQVTGRPISGERHQKIGPWVTIRFAKPSRNYVTHYKQVLHRIFGKVDFKKGAVSAAVPLRSQRLLERQPEEIPLEASRLSFKVQDEYDDFMRKEVLARSFGSLIPLPHVIDDIDVENGYLADDTIDPMKSGQDPVEASKPGQINSGVMAEDILPGTGGIAAAEQAKAEDIIQTVDMPARAVRDDIDSREVEELL